MKNLVLRSLTYTGLFSMLVLGSCDDKDQESIIGGGSAVITDDTLNGRVYSDAVLDASIDYELTGAYIIEDGASLTIPAGTKITANAGGTDVYIAVLKGGSIDIQGTESFPVVITSENGEPGDWGGLTICGDASTTAGVNAIAEVGGFVYGGSNDADNSGSITNLIIKGTGAQINADAQYNGISFYAVGSGTVVENIAVIDGDDDGVEFFGGSVSVKNIYLENNSDDSIDWTEGWNGTVENAFVSHTVAGFSTVLEGDKDNNNPKFINLTAVSSVGGTALQFKKQSGATITGLSLTGYSKNIDMKDAGALSNVQIDGADATTTDAYNAAATVDISNWNFINGVASGIELIKGPSLSGSVMGQAILNPAISYSLTGAFIVENGATLTIPAGTKITADAGGTDVYFAVLKGGKIEVQGTTTNPVVMSSTNGEPGDWGGLTICGDATTTAGVDAIAEVGGFIYGGTNDADNSGSIRNLVIRGTGAQINADAQYNGISFYGVGSGTVVENIAVIDGDDDGVEFFGGSVSVTNIYLENNSDDSIDWTEGWNGTVTNAYVSHTVAGFSTVLEGDKDNNNPKFVNLTAVSSVGGTALQFKKQSGATITGLSLAGYSKNIDMKDAGALSNVQIAGADATTTDAYDAAATVDISSWTWTSAEL